MYRVLKRDGSMMEFHIAKIGNAITKAFEAVGRQYHPSVIELLALRVTAEFEPKIRNDLISVEDIQDCVERVLSEAGYSDVAKAYILYRKQREKLRNVGSTLLNYKELVDNYLRINDWRVKENSTVTYSVGGLILSNSGAITANYWLSEIYDAEIAQAHRSAELHLHDLSMLTGYCAGWSLKQLIQEGLGGVPGKISSSPASHLSTLCNQMVNFLGIMQNEWLARRRFPRSIRILPRLSAQTSCRSARSSSACSRSFTASIRRLAGARRRRFPTSHSTGRFQRTWQIFLPSSVGVSSRLPTANARRKWTW